MAGYYDDDVATARELIQEFGAPVQLKVMTTTDGAQPWNTGTPGEQVAQVPMVFLDFKQAAATAGDQYWNGSLIHTGDKKVLCGQCVPVPNVNALLTRADGSVWRVVSVKTLDPNGQRVLHTMQVRQ